MSVKLFLIQLPSQLADPATFDRLLSYLDEPSQNHVKRFRLPEDSLRCLVGRVAPVWYLRKAGLISPSTRLSFNVNPNGKPSLKTHPKLSPPLDYNTSHDGLFVLFGVSRGETPDIGVDVMRCPPDEDAWDIQEGIYDQLTRGEKSVLSLNISPEQRTKIITTIWTFKEAYVKALGTGITFGLERIHVESDREAVVHGVHVDGRDVKLEGWKWGYGVVDDSVGARYGWTAFWRAESGVTPTPETIAWSNFTSALS